MEKHSEKCLKSCPFCDGEATIIFGRTRSDNYESFIYVMCKICQTKQKKYNEFDYVRGIGYISQLEISKKQAVQAWNRRA